MKFINKLLKVVFILSVIQLVSLALLAAENNEGTGKGKKKVGKTNLNDNSNFIDANKIEYWITNNGTSAQDTRPGRHDGLYYPKGSPTTPIYQDGFWWAGNVVQEDNTEILRAGGAEYASGLQAGKILTPGFVTNGVYTAPVADDAELDKYRVYKIVKDWQKLSNDNPLKAKYKKDYEEWPFEDGAPAVKNYKGGDSLTVDGKKIPRIIGNQTLFYVGNDLNENRVDGVFGSLPMGLEVQVSLFAFKQSPLGTMAFVKRKIINKSGRTIKDMYVSAWSDPDLGNAADDVVGVDTSLKLGFVWNGTNSDSKYGSAPPAAGYVFFQGALVPGLPTDTGLVDGKKIPGKKNQKLSSFAYYIGSGAPPCLAGPVSAQEVYYYQQGKDKCGNDLTKLDGVTPTKFPVDGDPETGGELDGTLFAPADRRLLLSSGSFTMAPGDTQEIVCAVIVGKGTSNKNSVTVLKGLAGKAQEVFDKNFLLPGPVPQPELVGTAYDQQIALDWSKPSSVTETEGNVQEDYRFQGYKLYQFPSPYEIDLSNAKLLGSWDVADGITKVTDLVDDPSGDELIKTVNLFSDNGVTRHFTVERDEINSIAFKNGREYYFGLVAVSTYKKGTQGPNDVVGVVVPSQFETSVDQSSIITVVPNKPDLGVRYATANGDSVNFLQRTAGVSEAIISAKISNPKNVTGGNYEVFTYKETDSKSPNFDKVVFNVRKYTDTTSDTLFALGAGQSATVADGGVEGDGVTIKIAGPEPAFTGFLTVSNANGALNPPEFGAADPNHQGFPRLNSNTIDQSMARQQVFTATKGLGWGIHVNAAGGAAADNNFAYFLTRAVRAGANWPVVGAYDYEIRFTAAGGIAVNWFSNGSLVNVPFELWNIGINTPNDPSDDYRMIAWLNNTQGDVDAFDIGGDHQFSGGADDPYSDWIYWMNPIDQTPGQAGYLADKAEAEANIATYEGLNVKNEVFARVVIGLWNGGTAAPYDRPMPETGTTFRMVTSKPAQAGEKWTYSTTANSFDKKLAENDLKDVNVYPNPYFGASKLDRSKFNRAVNFTNLPAKANIKIFTISGIFVNEVVKDNANSREAKWNMTNSNGLPVASGVYVVYIDTIYGTKILKLSVIQEQQYLDSI